VNVVKLPYITLTSKSDCSVSFQAAFGLMTCHWLFGIASVFIVNAL